MKAASELVVAAVEEVVEARCAPDAPYHALVLLQQLCRGLSEPGPSCPPTWSRAHISEQEFRMLCSALLVGASKDLQTPKQLGADFDA